MEAGALGRTHGRDLGERLTELSLRLRGAPYVARAAAGVRRLQPRVDDRRPLARQRRRVAGARRDPRARPCSRSRSPRGAPGLTAAIVLANLVAILILFYGVHDVAQRGVNGLSLGAIYALGAVGLTLVYGILKLVNFAHGDFLTFGAYMAYLVNVTWGGPLVLGIVFAIITTAGARARAREGDVGADAAQGRRDAAAAADGDRARVRHPLRDPVRLGHRAAPARRQPQRRGRAARRPADRAHRPDHHHRRLRHPRSRPA